MSVGCWYPCDCSNACRIAQDTFDSAADPPSGWTEVSGSDWATSGGTLRTATNNALLKFSTAQPDGIASMYVSVKVYGAAGDQFKAIVAYVDSSNYHYVKLTLGSPNGCFALYRRVGGSDTLISSRRVDAAASTWHQLQLWFGQDIFMGLFGNPSAFDLSEGRLYHKESGYTGTYAGLGTGTVSGTVQFDDFNFYLHRIDEDGKRSCPGSRPNCELFEDDCTRANDTDVGCSYDEASGSWSITTNALQTTSSDAQLVLQVKHPFDRCNVILSATVRTNVDGDVVRLIVARTGPNDYYCAEYTLTASSGVIHKLRQCVGGVFTDLATETTTYGPDFDYNVDVCIGGGRMASGSLGVDLVTPTPMLYDVALATGSVSGTIRFDSVLLRIQGQADRFDYSLNDTFDLACESCITDCCCGNDGGEEWILTIEDLTGVNNRCSNCNLDGEYTLSYDADLSSEFGSCIYNYTDPDWCDDSYGCGPIALKITLNISTFGGGCTFFLSVSLEASGAVSPCLGINISHPAQVYSGDEGCQDPDFVPIVWSSGPYQDYPSPVFPSSDHLCEATDWIALTPTFTLRPA